MADETDLTLDAWLNDDEDERESVAPAPVEAEAPPETPDEPSPAKIEAAIEGTGDRGDGRDAQGRFVGKSEVAEGADAAPVAADATAPAVDGAPPATEGEAPPAADDAPFAFRVADHELFIPGSKIAPDGSVIIPKESRELVEAYLGKGAKLEMERAAIKEERAQARYDRAVAKQEATVAQAKAAAFRQEVDRQMQIADIPDDTQFAEQWLAYGLELRAAKPTLQREMELAEREARLQVQQMLQAPDPSELREQVDAVIDADLPTIASELQQDPALNALTEKDWGELQRLVAKERARFYYRAGERLSPEEQAAGIQPGQIVRDTARIREEALRIQAIRADAKAEAERIRKEFEAAKKVAEENAKKLAAAKGAPPQASRRPPPVERKAPETAEPDEFTEEALYKEFSAVFGR